jgi:hypothetical protein
MTRSSLSTDIRACHGRKSDSPRGGRIRETPGGQPGPCRRVDARPVTSAAGNNAEALQQDGREHIIILTEFCKK